MGQPGFFARVATGYRWLTLLNARRTFALSYYQPALRQIRKWVFCNREFTNFTYDLTDLNKAQLIALAQVVTGLPLATLEGYLAEILGDDALRQQVITATRASELSYMAEEYCEFSRRIGWYLFVRALKPKTVIETGVDKGLGAVVLCAALLKNQAEGSPGRYYGTDINPKAGYLLQAPYSGVGEILVGDSIESLKKFPDPIDFFVNDSDHSATYEYQEYVAIQDKLSAHALILGDNSHVTDSLVRFSRETGRRFLFFKEYPKDHWYPGGGIGVSFVA